ncbi:hypothetical protein [Streptomyces sp. NPDC094466]|uniref:hypothetical protein n=1 Tax=Streptomyces sp. NPDC094466 TaxID=3366065 RepID=UPI003801E94C
MTSLDRVVRQAPQLTPLNRIVEMVVLGEDDPTWLQHKIAFKNLRNVHYYLAATRWARLFKEDAIRSTSLGRRYVSSRFEPRVILEGVRGFAAARSLRRSGAWLATTCRPRTSSLASCGAEASVTASTVTRRARDFCAILGRIIDEAANPKERKLVGHSAWLEPQDLLAINCVTAIWPALQLTPVKGIWRSKNTSRGEATDAQLRLPLKEVA